MKIINGDCLEELARIPDASIHAVVTDPPYGLGNTSPENVAACLRAWLDGERHDPSGGGFMGRAWDSWVPGPEVWRECLRVLKPGGHVLAFAGTRTVDLMALALRLAGFEVRDMLAWHYGSGFPKSLDVSKAIDAAGGSSPVEQAATLRARRRAGGMTRADVAEALGCSEASVRDWEEGRSRAVGAPVEFVVPSAEYRAKLADLLGYSSDERRAAGVYTDRRGDGTVIGLGHSGELKTGGHTDAAREWSGWGTALKPSWEPIILARKPLTGTVAANVLEHGAGALNVDGCRVEAPTADREDYGLGNEPTGGMTGGTYGEWSARRTDYQRPTAGRWPPNAVLVHPPHCDGDRNGRGCVEGCPVGEMGRQSGWSGGDKRGKCAGRRPGGFGNVGADKGDGTLNAAMPGDSGTAARFFYQAKASRAEREAGVGGELRDANKSNGGGIGERRRQAGQGQRRNHHPTVKPVDLMRWLVRLVTPPGGTVLDPFTGSGTTGCACAVEGFEFIGIEREPEYADIARQRVAWWSEHGERAVAAQAARDAADRFDAETDQQRLFK